MVRTVNRSYSIKILCCIMRKIVAPSSIRYRWSFCLGAPPLFPNAVKESVNSRALTALHILHCLKRAQPNAQQFCLQPVTVWVAVNQWFSTADLDHLLQLNFRILGWFNLLAALGITAWLATWVRQLYQGNCLQGKNPRQSPTFDL